MQEPVVSFLMGPREQTQAERLAHKFLYLMSHLTTLSRWVLNSMLLVFILLQYDFILYYLS